LSHGSQKRRCKDICGFRRIQEETGLTAVSLQYPSTRQPINKLAAGVAEEVKDLVLQGGHEGVWAVTHSLGGIVQRHIMGLPDQGTACELSPLTNVQLMLLADACEHDQQTMHALSGCVLTTWSTYMLAGGISWKGIVMIAPPNQGSTVAHQLSGLPGIGKLFQYA